MGQRFSLGAIPSSEQNDMVRTLEPSYMQLDTVLVWLNQARDEGFDTTGWLDIRSGLQASLDRLQARVNDLETAEDVHAWNAERNRISAGASQLVLDVEAGITQLRSGSKMNVGIWVGAAVLGAVGTVLLVRWYGKKRRRR